jgi:hypothetical protein
MGAAMGAAAIGGAVGGIVGQGLAMATGYQEKFSWSQVAMSAVGSAVSAGVGSAFAPAAGAAAATPSVFQVAGQAALGNIVTQGANKILGLDKTKKFDWRGVAASAVGAVAGQALGNAMGQPATQMSGFIQNSVKGFATGVLSSIVRREDKPNYAAIAGNAIAGALTEELGWDPIAAEDAYNGQVMRQNLAAYEQTRAARDPATQADIRTTGISRERAYAWRDDATREQALNRAMTAFTPQSVDADGGSSLAAPQSSGGGRPYVVANADMPMYDFGPSGLGSPGETGPVENPLKGLVDAGKTGLGKVAELIDALTIEPLRDAKQWIGQTVEETAKDLDAQGQGAAANKLRSRWAIWDFLLPENVLDFIPGGKSRAGIKVIDEVGSKALDGGAKMVGEAGSTVGKVADDLAVGARRAAEDVESVAARARSLGFETTDAVAVSGKRPIELGHSYEAAVRSKQYDAVPFQQRQFEVFENGKWVDATADNVAVINGKMTAIEMKHVDDWAVSLRNPLSKEPWAVAEQQRMLVQAERYSKTFDQVVYHTNSIELATHYNKVFTEMGMTNLKFIITPAKR